MPETATFAVYLIVLLVVGIVLSAWQGRRYGDQVRALIRAHRGEDLHLVSGRAKARLRGAVALLLVDPATTSIVEARVMSGASVFARIRPAPELTGPIADAPSRATHPMVAKAVAEALTLLPTVTRRTPRPTRVARRQPAAVNT